MDPLAPATRSASAQSLHDLDQLTTGTLYTRESADWDIVRMPWLLNVDQHPIAVLEVADRDDVVAAVRWAGDNGVQVTAQPNGHGANGDLRGALILRTGRLDDIDVDADRRTARVGAGVNSGQLGHALAGTGLAFLIGSNPHPSVVGLTLAGGLSWFGRAFGLGCDSIVSAEIVDGAGRIRQVRAEDEPDILWALRGGGGDFAIIVSLEIALHPAPAIYGGRMFWPVEAMGEVLRAFRTVCESAPEGLSTWYHTFQFPPIPEVPEPFRGKSFCVIALVLLGDRAEADELLAPLRAVPGLAMELLGDVPIEQVAELADEPTDPMPGLLRSTLVDRIDDDTIDRLVSVIGPGTQTPLTMLQVRHLGGALQRTPPLPGAHGPIQEPYNVQALGILPAPELAPAITAALEQVLDAVSEVSSGRTLMNFLDHDQQHAWWDEPTRTRLQNVKQDTDPANTIRGNRPILF